MQPAFMEDGASPPKPQQKKHGGSRHVVLDPPVYLLFDDPANRPAEDDGPSLVAGRAAKIRWALHVDFVVASHVSTAVAIITHVGFLCFAVNC